MKNLIDYMLENEASLHISIALILSVSYIIFVKINKINFFFFTVFIGIKFCTSTYVDKYIEKKKKLQEFNESHILTVKFLTSIIVIIPFLILGYFIGKHIPLSEE